MQRLRSCKASGLTLFEIIVAMALVGLIMGLTIGGMGRLLEWDMKKASNRLVSTMRYLYNKSATEGMFIRLVLDLDEHVYWVEATMDPFVVSRGEGGLGAAEESKEETETKTLKGAWEEEGEVQKLKPRKAKFGQVDSFLLKPTKLPSSVFFKDVYVEHRPAPVEAGKVSIFFFPNGYVEEAVINLRDEDDEVHYSLTTNPISGRVQIESRYKRGAEG